MVSSSSDSSSDGTNRSSASSRSPTSPPVANLGQRRVVAPQPTNPSNSLSTFLQSRDGLHMLDLDRPLSPIGDRPLSPIGSIGMWVTPGEAEHARTLARVAAERSAELKLLRAQLYLSEDREGAANNMSDMLAERVADLSELAAERGIAFARAWTLIQSLIAALVLSSAFAMILAFK